MNKPQIFGAVRHGLTFVAGYFLAKHPVTDPTINADTITSAVLTLVGFAWSFIEKKNPTPVPPAA